MNCENCGNPVEADAKFCRVCGAQVNGGNVETPVQEVPTQVEAAVANEPITEEVVATPEQVVETSTFVEPTIEENNQTINTEEVLNEKKPKNNLVFIIMVVLMIIIIAGLGILLFLNNKNREKNNETTTTTTATTTTTTTATTAPIELNKVNIDGMSIIVPDGFETKTFYDMPGLYNASNNRNYYGFSLSSGSVDDLITNQETYKANLIAKGYENPVFERKTAKCGLPVVLDYYVYSGVSYGEYFIQLDTDSVLAIYISNFDYNSFALYDSDIDIMISNLVKNNSNNA